MAVLTYFTFRGLGEPIRLMLHDLGVAFEDRRVDFSQWDALKPQMMFGQMPRFEDEGGTLFQSQAILRHLARPRGLCGESEDEAIACDVSVEAARDLQQRLWDHFWAPGSDAAEAAEAFAAGTLAAQLGMTSAWLGERPYFGGARPLFCDYFALTALDEAAGFFPAAVAAEPALAGYRTRMYARPGLAAYAASGRQPETYGFDPIRGLRKP
jgi:glutathione S-transferase